MTCVRPWIQYSSFKTRTPGIHQNNYNGYLVIHAIQAQARFRRVIATDSATSAEREAVHSDSSRHRHLPYGYGTGGGRIATFQSAVKAMEEDAGVVWILIDALAVTIPGRMTDVDGPGPGPRAHRTESLRTAWEFGV
ncbi:hypothetical protein SISSUDRAFT_388726 [Sistotremastrum suecicum HHB10207 ss-3]|uniref:Uncharacterized protein n=1 Tax=Sistotremastrum suecicum HHB10207 ss-3 TaxID=1314776 RepID=A0A166FWQ5_9AGAM|nr:hypothetical protein SISSUDRAFT_388726 [Sistotremastrum suecicum HHB10207 ss-3]